MYIRNLVLQKASGFTGFTSETCLPKHTQISRVRPIFGIKSKNPKLENKQGLPKLLAHLQNREWLGLVMVYGKNRAHDHLSFMKTEENAEEDESVATQSTTVLAACSPHSTTREQYRACLPD